MTGYSPSLSNEPAGPNSLTWLRAVRKPGNEWGAPVWGFFIRPTIRDGNRIAAIALFNQPMNDLQSFFDSERRNMRLG